MTITKITDKGKTGDIHSSSSEIIFTCYGSGVKKLYAFDKTRIVREIDKEYFGLKVIGDCFEKINNQLPNPIQDYKITKSQNGIIYFSFYQDELIYGFNNEGIKVFVWKDKIGNGHAIYDIKFQEPDFLWLSFPSGQTITQISISTKEEVYKIGNYSYDENDVDILSFPESTFVKKNELYIPNMGNGKLLKLDTISKEINLHAIFEEKIWEYIESEIGTFIVTGNGIFEIEN